MTEVENLILARLNRMQGDVTAIGGRLDDIVVEMRRLADSVAVLRGTADGLRHDVDVLAKRYHDHEARLRELEPEADHSPPGAS